MGYGNEPEALATDSLGRGSCLRAGRGIGVCLRGCAGAVGGLSAGGGGWFRSVFSICVFHIPGTPELGRGSGPGWRSCREVGVSAGRPSVGRIESVAYASGSFFFWGPMRRECGGRFPGRNWGRTASFLSFQIQAVARLWASKRVKRAQKARKITDLYRFGATGRTGLKCLKIGRIDGKRGRSAVRKARRGWRAGCGVGVVALRFASRLTWVRGGVNPDGGCRETTSKMPVVSRCGVRPRGKSLGGCETT